MNQVKGTGASSTLFQHDRPNKPQVSRFDLSRKVNFSLDTGMIVPIELLETYPGDTFRISHKMALDTLPLVAPSLTNYKIVTHFYYMKKRDTWRGWKTFSTKGRSGNVNLSVPQVDLTTPINTMNFSLKVPSGDSVIQQAANIYPVSNHSLSSFLGVPPDKNGIYGFTSYGSSGTYIIKNYVPYSFTVFNGSQSQMNASQRDAYNKSVSTGFNVFKRVSALPFVMYQSICKNFYVNPNLLQDNHALFPVEGDDEWLLPYVINDGVANYISGKSRLTSDNKINYDGVYSNDETDVDLRLLRYAMFDDDYFTTALKDLQRGDVTTLESVGSLSGMDLSSVPNNSFVQLFASDKSNPYVDVNGDSIFYKAVKGDNDALGNSHFKSPFSSPNGVTDLSVMVDGDIPAPYLGVSLSQLKSTLVSKFNSSKVSLSMTANQMRSLIAMSVWQERNMRVDGSYNKMIYQHFAVNPRSEEHVPVYIGGTVDYLNFSTVIQNSESSTSSPLGSTAGFGSSGGEGSVCSNFYCPDHGYIMGVMIIKPETIYQQGVDKLLTEITFDDFAQPEFQGLSPEGILNKEIYVSGNDTDNDLFAYQERYTYLKVRQNVNRGLMQCKPDKDLLFSAYTQARWFESVPKFSYQFLCMSPDNLRRDWLAYPSYPAFRCQLLNEVFVIRKLSYTSEPNTFGF